MIAARGRNEAVVIRLAREPGVVASLLKAVGAPGYNRVYAMRALAMAREKRGVRPLMALLKKEQDPEVIRHIIRALGEIGDASVAEAIIPYAISDNEDDARAAGRALRMLKVRGAFPELRRAFWERRRSREIDSIMLSVDTEYHRGARKVYAAVSWILLTMLLLAPALLSLALARSKMMWMVRLVVAGANAYVANHLGLFAGVLGSRFLFEGSGPSHGLPIYLLFYGFYCAFFCALGTLVRVGGGRTWAGALALGALPMAYIPLLFWGFLSAPWQSWSMETSELLKFVASVSPVSLLVFVDYLIISRLIKSILDKGAESGVDRMGWRGFGGMVVFMGALCLLPLPLTRLAMAFLY